MYKLLLVVFAVLAVASAQYIASPYYGGAGYGGGLYKTGASGYYGAGIAASPYAYSNGYTGYGGLGGYGGLYY